MSEELDGLDLLFGPDLSTVGVMPVVDPRNNPAPRNSPAARNQPPPYGSATSRPRRMAQPQQGLDQRSSVPVKPSSGFDLRTPEGQKAYQAWSKYQDEVEFPRQQNRDLAKTIVERERIERERGRQEKYWPNPAETRREWEAKNGTTVERFLGGQEQTEAEPEPTSTHPQNTPLEELDGLDLLFGGKETQKPQLEQQLEQQQAGQPDRQSNTGSRVTDAYNYMTGAYNYMTGADRDPKYKDAVDFDTRQLLPKNATDNAQFAPYRAARLSMLAGATDAQLGDVIELQLGDRFIRRFKDKNGMELVEYKDADGKKRTDYINTPGLDMGDVGRGLEGTAPYLTAARFASGLGGAWGAQTALQGTAAGGTSLVGDVVSAKVGSKQGIDPFKALVTAGFAAGAQLTAPAAGFLWRRLVKEPQLFNQATGELTEKGAAAAREAGLDPGQLTRVMARQFARDLAKSNNAKETGMRVIADGEFGVPTTLGQRTKSIPQLTDEGVIKYGGYGDDAARSYQNFAENQARALEDASVGSGVFQPGINPDKASLAKTIAPEFAGTGGVPPRQSGQVIGEGVRKAYSAAKAEEKLAWDAVKDIVPTLDALKRIPNIVDEAKYITSIAADDIGTPTSLRMIDRLESLMTGTVNKVEGLRGRASEIPKTVDGMRRQLTTILSDAQTPTDKKLAGAIYDRYNEWIKQSAKDGLLSGDSDAAAALFSAVDITKQLHRVFRPSKNAGQKSASRIMEKILDDAVTPERLVDDLFGSVGSSPKVGVKEALTSIQAGLKKLGDKDAQETWNAIRIAYLNRLVKSKAGDVTGPQAIQTNFKKAFEQQYSIMRILYNPKEIAQMRRFQTMLEGVVAPVVNSSGSGFVGVAQARRGISQVVEKFTGKFIADLFDRSLGGIVKGAQGASAVGRALSQSSVPSRPPTLGGYGGAAGATIERQPKLDRNRQRVLVPQ